MLAYSMINRDLGDRAWATVRERWSEVEERFPSPLVIRMVEGVRFLSRPEQVAEADAFFAGHPIPQSTKMLEQMLERQRVAAALRERATPDLAGVLLRRLSLVWPAGLREEDRSDTTRQPSPAVVRRWRKPDGWSGSGTLHDEGTGGSGGGSVEHGSLSSTCVVALLLPLISLPPGNLPSAEAHGDHTGPPDQSGMNAYCSLHSMRQGGVPPATPAPSVWISCQYGPTSSLLGSIAFDLRSSDKQGLSGDWQMTVDFTWDDCQVPGTTRQCIINENGLFQMAIVETGASAPTTPWNDLRASGCLLNYAGSTVNHNCEVGVYSKATPGYPMFPVHWWPGGVDGNKVPIGQTYGLPDEDGRESHGAVGRPGPNSLTGSFYSSMTDMSLPGVGRPFRITRTYNSGGSLDGTTYLPINGVMGRGWRFTYGAYLEILAGGDLRRRRLRKQSHYYLQNDGVSFLRRPGVTASMVKNANGTYTLTRRNGSQLKFKATGELTSITDRNANTISLTYAGGDLSTITDTAGRVIDVDTNTSGKITRFTLPDGRFVAYAYGSNNLLSVTDLAGNLWEYTYNGANRLASIEDPRNIVTVQNTYMDGRATSQVDGEGNASSYAWDEATRTATFTDEENKVWKHVYDAGNKLIETIPPTGAADKTRYEYDPATLKRSKVIEPDGDTWTWAYTDRLGGRDHADDGDRSAAAGDHHDLHGPAPTRHGHRPSRQGHRLQLRCGRQPHPDRRTRQRHHRLRLCRHRQADVGYRPQRQDHDVQLRREGQPHEDHRPAREEHEPDV